MKINEGVINDPTASTLEVDFSEDELRKLKDNNNNNNKNEIKYEKKCKNIGSMSCRDILFYISLLVIIVSCITLLYSIIYLVITSMF